MEDPTCPKELEVPNQQEVVAPFPTPDLFWDLFPFLSILFSLLSSVRESEGQKKKRVERVEGRRTHKVVRGRQVTGQISQGTSWLGLAQDQVTGLYCRVHSCGCWDSHSSLHTGKTKALPTETSFQAYSFCCPYNGFTLLRSHTSVVRQRRNQFKIIRKRGV